MSPMDILNDHLVGTWVGVNHSYVKNPAVTYAVTITITKDKEHGRLKFRSTYVREGTKKTDHDESFFTIDPMTATL